jgi:citrate synthase
VTDERTGKCYELPIENGAVRAAALGQIRAGGGDRGLVCYDPGLLNTAVCRSAITFVDGERSELRYRGIPVEELAAKSTFLETAYLIVKGELPAAGRLAAWTRNVNHHRMVHENVKKFMEGFRYDAHPMGILIGTLGALSTFYPDAKNVLDPESRRLQTRRLLGKMPTLAAWAYRHSRGLPYVPPDDDSGYVANFCSMMFRMSEQRYRVEPVLERALEVLFLLHADHEQNCSTNALRCVASAHADPYSAVAAAVAALYGPRHGGANEAVIHMLSGIGSYDNIPAFVESVKAGEGRLMGFGHRVYKAYDPRARIVKAHADEVFKITGRNPLLDIALKLEEIALSDDYFMSRNLYPNVDFYTGLIYQAMNFPLAMFTVLFAMGRMPGWLSHWQEALEQGSKISRPRQIYDGPGPRSYVPVGDR